MGERHQQTARSSSSRTFPRIYFRFHALRAWPCVYEGKVTDFGLENGVSFNLATGLLSLPPIWEPSWDPGFISHLTLMYPVCFLSSPRDMSVFLVVRRAPRAFTTENVKAQRSLKIIQSSSKVLQTHTPEFWRGCDSPEGTRVELIWDLNLGF